MIMDVNLVCQNMRFKYLLHMQAVKDQTSLVFLHILTKTFVDCMHKEWKQANALKYI